MNAGELVHVKIDQHLVKFLTEILWDPHRVEYVISWEMLLKHSSQLEYF